MSRAAWVALVCLGAAAGLTFWLLTRPLPEDVKTQAKAAVTALETAESAQRERETELEALLGQDSAYLQDRPEVKKAREILADQARVLAESRAVAEGDLKKLLDKNKHGDRKQVAELAAKVARPAGLGGAATASSLAEVKKLLDYKANHAQLLEAGRAAVQAAGGALGEAEPPPGGCDDDAALAGYQMAITAFPEAKTRLDERLAKLRDHAQQMKKSGTLMEATAARKPIDYAMAGQQAEALALGGAEAAHAV